MSGDSQIYEISVNDQKYRFASSDSEKHVKQMEQHIQEVIEALRQSGEGHQLSDYAVKIALMLADRAAKVSGGVSEEDLRERFKPLVDELDSLIQAE